MIFPTDIYNSTSIPENGASSVASVVVIPILLIGIVLLSVVSALCVWKYLRNKKLSLKRNNSPEISGNSSESGDHDRDIANVLNYHAGFSDHDYDCVNLESGFEIEYSEVHLSNSSLPRLDVIQEGHEQELQNGDHIYASASEIGLKKLSTSGSELDKYDKQYDEVLYHSLSSNINIAASADLEMLQSSNSKLQKSGSDGQLNCDYAVINIMKKKQVEHLSCDFLNDILNEHMTPVIPMKSEDLLSELEERST